MSTYAPQHRHSASLQRHFLWLLLSVAGLFAAGIALSLWFSLQAGGQTQQRLLELEARQARVSLVRLLDYYHKLIDNTARDPELIDLMRVGTIEEQQQWAISRQRLLPDLLGLALVNPQGGVLGEAVSLRVGPRCQQDMQRADTLMNIRPLLHREVAGSEHIDLVSAVRETDGEILGGVFLSVRLTQLQRVIDDTFHPDHALILINAAGSTIARQGEIKGALREVRLDIPETGWTLLAQAPVQRFTRGGEMQVLAGLLTLGAVLLLLGATMLRLRRAMLRDIVSTRDALTALARDEAVPAIVPHYVEFEPAAADINRIALHLQEQRARLEHLSLTDPLTELPNRRAFETRFPQAQGLAERQHPVALVLLDIDRFKGINDRYGHGVGDQVLLALAQSLKELTRRADLAARLAGDEFVVLLSGLDTSGVNVWYQRLSDRFRSELNAFGLDLQIGLSAGQTWLGSASSDTMNDALARADHALYQAKALGRGQLVQDGAPGAE
ncbi:MAG: GGDEF domain-containing protein [Rhodoferax sp.]|uniref:GGDEF domain-containing protein n=1 Tax=Rhodoferax sp. TaxID=50421 RepID=UPI0027309089|nr:GGDEF domain-containing protein [Rhodoferax sp.]MDP1529422.1 GGDEF domain-containing protein [Rhodoferax sp.]MDP2056808.1 GGDEF domain-containing protein [Thiobacillus sp.]